MKKVTSNDIGFEKAKETTITPLVNLKTGKEPYNNIDNSIDEENHSHQTQIIWPNIAFVTVVNIAAIYGLWNLFKYSKTPRLTFFFAWGYGNVAAMAVTVAHRLWAHRCYKATLPLRIILMLMHSVSIQNNIYVCVRNHLVKYTDTDADPHNSKRGFSFSHMSWLMEKKHPDVKKRGHEIDMSDILNDPVVRFQMRHELFLNLILSIIIPTCIPIYIWNETFNISFLSTISRFISPTENLIEGIMAFSEGWHSYHHDYPWDYKAPELRNYRINWTTAFIEICAFLGLAYDLKTVPEELVEKRVQRKDDDTCENYSHDDNVWGWDDPDLTKENKKGTQIFAKIPCNSEEL